MTRTADEIKDAVKEHYGERARTVAASCCGDSTSKGGRDVLYLADEVADLPETVTSYGCGNPTAIAGLREGETVLDLGSGAGLDCFLSAKAVGAQGRVIGLDMTDDMLALANANRDKLGATNVEFRKGEMEAMPIDDATVNVIISNCVINLSPDKDAVFRESFRVLAPGGRFHVSDVVLSRELSAGERDDLALWAGCASGALVESDYLGRLVQAGFTDITVDSRSAIGKKPWYSATISAHKPVTPRKPATETTRVAAKGGCDCC
jgi:2-polyprenyl-3-methyl-5-hydroxy-6-metoxy-1,4-benzoquinol methylase